jgi:hypothetical protein
MEIRIRAYPDTGALLVACLRAYYSLWQLLLFYNECADISIANIAKLNNSFDTLRGFGEDRLMLAFFDLGLF